MAGLAGAVRAAGRAAPARSPLRDGRSRIQATLADLGSLPGVDDDLGRLHARPRGDKLLIAGMGQAAAG
jgi:hypothetical protein